MKVASALITGSSPTPALAEAAVHAALAKAGLHQAHRVVLFLTRDFARQAAPAVRAAARAAGSLEVFGGTVFGLFNESECLLDQSGAVALVMDHAGQTDVIAPVLSLASGSSLPHDWQAGTSSRVGMITPDGELWAHGRLCDQTRAELSLGGLRTVISRSSGLETLAGPMTVDQVRGLDVLTVNGQPPLQYLRQHLPLERQPAPPIHQLVLSRQPDLPAIAILCANADGSLTLAEPLSTGDTVYWGLRHPAGAENDMRACLSQAVDTMKNPDFALMFSCIGRGPLFYGQDDRDLAVFREQFPTTPLIGIYGSGQIATTLYGNRLFQNSAVTVLCQESSHV